MDSEYTSMSANVTIVQECLKIIVSLLSSVPIEARHGWSLEMKEVSLTA